MIMDTLLGSPTSRSFVSPPPWSVAIHASCVYYRAPSLSLGCNQSMASSNAPIPTTTNDYQAQVGHLTEMFRRGSPERRAALLQSHQELFEFRPAEPLFLGYTAASALDVLLDSEIVSQLFGMMVNADKLNNRVKVSKCKSNCLDNSELTLRI